MSNKKYTRLFFTPVSRTIDKSTFSFSTLSIVTLPWSTIHRFLGSEWLKCGDDFSIGMSYDSSLQKGWNKFITF